MQLIKYGIAACLLCWTFYPSINVIIKHILSKTHIYLPIYGLKGFINISFMMINVFQDDELSGNYDEIPKDFIKRVSSINKSDIDIMDDNWRWMGDYTLKLK